MRNLTALKRHMKWILNVIVLVCTGATLVSAQATKGISRVSQAVPESGRKMALIIGNANYQTAPLRNPVNDARMMSRTLRGLGFDVDLLEDASQRDMKRAIDRFGKKLQDGGLGLFYYSGHGMQVEGHNYMIPVKAQIGAEEDVEYESVDVGRVLAKMEAARNVMNLVILDACRNNPYARSFRSAAQGLATLNAPSGTFIAYATAPGSVASDGSGSNGLYTGELIHHMQTPGLKLEEVFKRVRASVQDKSNGSQVPWDASSLTGDFFFVKAQPEPPKAITRVEPAPEASSSTAPAPSQYRADEEAWELVKDSENTEDFEFFVESFPASKLRKVAELKLKMLERRRTKQANAQPPVEVDGPQEVKPVLASNSGVSSLERAMRKEYQELQLGATKGRQEAFVEKYARFSWAYEEVRQVKQALAQRSANSGSQGSSEFDEARMMSEYSRLNYQPNGQKYEEFISRYEKFPEAEKQVAYVRDRLQALKKAEIPDDKKRDFARNRRFRALYEAAMKESRETVGCGLFGFGCPDPLVFPEYQQGFHLKSYRRVKVNGNRASWTETGVKLDVNDVAVVMASGAVKICSSCSKRGMLSLDESWLLSLRVGEAQKPKQIWWVKRNSIHTVRFTSNDLGELKFLVPEREVSHYKDNAGSFLLDVFVFEGRYEEEFNTFREALMRANPEDEHMQAYLGR